MTETICDISNQIQISPHLTPEQTIDRSNHTLDYINIFPLIKTTDIISLSNLSIMEYNIYRTSMILNIKPVPHIFTLTIDRQRLTMTYIINKQWNQLLRKLIWTIIVRTVRHYSRHSIRIMKSPHEVITTRLRGRVR